MSRKNKNVAMLFKGDIDRLERVCVLSLSFAGKYLKNKYWEAEDD